MYFLNAMNKLKPGEKIARLSKRDVLVEKEDEVGTVKISDGTNIIQEGLSLKDLNACDWEFRRLGEEELNAEFSLRTIRNLMKLVFSEKYMPKEIIEACKKNFGYEYGEDGPDVLTPERILELKLTNEYSNDEINNVVRVCKNSLDELLKASAESVKAATAELCEVKMEDNDFPF